MADIPTTEPSQIRAGDTLQWRREDLTDDYPASEWTLTYYLLKSDQQITIVATADEDYFEIEVAKAVSAEYPAGIYSWIAKVTDGTDEFTIGQGTMEILPDLTAEVTGYDTRSHAKKVLEALESVIEGRASKDAVSYTIAGRSITKLTPDELIRWRNHYRVEYQRELNRELIEAGKTPKNTIKVKFRSAS